MSAVLSRMPLRSLRHRDASELANAERMPRQLILARYLFRARGLSLRVGTFSHSLVPTSHTMLYSTSMSPPPVPVIAYVCTLWLGERRGAPAPASHASAHVTRLTTLPFSPLLSKIVFVLNTPPRPRALPLPLYVKHAEVSLLVRPNLGGSYAALAHAAQNIPAHFYIFIEDDYLPALPYFDLALLHLMLNHTNSHPTRPCGYLATLTHSRQYGHHAAMASGLLSAQALTGYTPPLIDVYDAAGQLSLGDYVLSKGYALCDTTSHYRAPFWDGHQVIDLAPQHTQALFEPVESISMST